MSNQKKQPVLDEQTFGKLLEAAYVMQEHNRKRQELEESKKQEKEPLPEEPNHQALPAAAKVEAGQGSYSDADYAPTLAAIAEAQHQIQIRHLELDQAMTVVAESVARITRAKSAAIGILEGEIITYRAATAFSALPAGSKVPLEKSIGQPCIRTGQVIRAADLQSEKLFDTAQCVQRGILSLIAVPIYHDGGIIGDLELYFDRAHGFAEPDVHTCQLMAGLVTEAMSREAQSNLKKSVATERSAMIAAIERLKPGLAGMAEDRPRTVSHSRPVSTPSGTFPCWKCGNSLLLEEQFCGKCGAPRTEDDSSSTMQSKFASAWHSQQNKTPAVNESLTAGEPELFHGRHLDDGHIDFPEEEGFDFPPAPFPVETAEEEVSKEVSPAELFAPLPTFEGEREEELPPSPKPTEEGHSAPESTALVVPPREDAVWSSAAKARQFLESVAVTRKVGAFMRLWRAHRGYFYLGIAFLLMLAVVRWGMWSDSAVASGRSGAVARGTGRRNQPAPDADLSAFDKLLVSLGLAEPPDAPEYKGNPDTQVWVDLHTALYYCPGSDLYGKTAKGRISTQRNAQLDQFEPADRKACD